MSAHPLQTSLAGRTITVRARTAEQAQLVNTALQSPVIVAVLLVYAELRPLPRKDRKLVVETMIADLKLSAPTTGNSPWDRRKKQAKTRAKK